MGGWPIWCWCIFEDWLAVQEKCLIAGFLFVLHWILYLMVNWTVCGEYCCMFGCPSEIVSAPFLYLITCDLHCVAWILLFVWLSKRNCLGASWCCLCCPSFTDCFMFLYLFWISSHLPQCFIENECTVHHYCIHYTLLVITRWYWTFLTFCNVSLVVQWAKI